VSHAVSPIPTVEVNCAVGAAVPAAVRFSDILEGRIEESRIF
jgi:hypothetical protein